MVINGTKSIRFSVLKQEAAMASKIVLNRNEKSVQSQVFYIGNQGYCSLLFQVLKGVREINSKLIDLMPFDGEMKEFALDKIWSVPESFGTESLFTLIEQGLEQTSEFIVTLQSIKKYVALTSILVDQITLDVKNVKTDLTHLTKILT